MSCMFTNITAGRGCVGGKRVTPCAQTWEGIVPGGLHHSRPGWKDQTKEQQTNMRTCRHTHTHTHVHDLLLSPDVASYLWFLRRLTSVWTSSTGKQKSCSVFYLDQVISCVQLSWMNVIACVWGCGVGQWCDRDPPHIYTVIGVHLWTISRLFF